MERHQRDAWHDVWMLTLAPPHYADEAGELVVERLYRATEILWRKNAWRRFADQHGVVGRVRVLDATHGGANGSHPHFHVALFVQRALMPTTWTPSARARRGRVRFASTDGDLVESLVRALTAPAPVDGTSLTSSLLSTIQPLRMAARDTRAAYLDELRGDLLDAWEASCREAGIPIEQHAAFRSRSLLLSPSEDAASYFVKWGLADEVGAPTNKQRSHLRLLDLVAAGVDRAGDVYRAWRRAVHGRTWVTGLGDICTRLGVTDDDATAYLAELRRRRERQLELAGTPALVVPELALVVKSHLFPAALRLGWEQVFALCDQLAAAARAADDVQAELDRVLWRHLSSSQGPPNRTGDNTS